MKKKMSNSCVKKPCALHVTNWRSSISNKIHNETEIHDEMMKVSATGSSHSNVIANLGQEEKKLVLMMTKANEIGNEMTTNKIVLTV